MSRKAAFVSILVAAMAFAHVASGSDKRVNVEVVSTVRVGDGFPKLVVSLKDPIPSVAVFLKGSDGTRLERVLRHPKAGRHEFELRQAPGTVSWSGRLVVEFANEGERELALSFDTTLRDVPKLAVAEGAVDLEKRTLGVVVDSDGGTIEVQVVSDEGAEVFRATQAFDGVRANEPRVVSWKQPDNIRVFRINLRAIDSYGLYADLELYPWRIDVPHEDVLFDSGEATLRADETPKLERSWQELRQALEKYGRFAKVQLFIAGHTDTVGEAMANQALSEARAVAIGRWFQKRGVKVPVFYAGLGESSLLVPTADGVDEPRNRRVEYIVAVEPPSGIGWKRVR